MSVKTYICLVKHTITPTALIFNQLDEEGRAGCFTFNCLPCFLGLLFFCGFLMVPWAGHGFTALNVHEIWPRLLWEEHILYIRAKMTSFFNIR